MIMSVFVFIHVLSGNRNSKIKNLSILQFVFLSLKNIGVAFVGLLYDLVTFSITLSHVSTESIIILFKYSSILQKRILGFQTQSFLHRWIFFIFKLTLTHIAVLLLI